MNLTDDSRFDLDFNTINNIFDILNEAGHGFAVGDEDTPIYEIAELGNLVWHGGDDGGCAVYHNGGDLVTVVPDHNGPWAVTASLRSLQR